MESRVPDTTACPGPEIRVHPDLEDITAIGVDEFTYGKWHKYMTLVYQINSGRKRLLGVIRDRDTQSLTSFFETFGVERSAKIKVVCSDIFSWHARIQPPAVAWSQGLSAKTADRVWSFPQ